jgi:hypothetical protein
MEQPTIFYPTVVVLALTGASGLDVALAWTYVALRVLHSLVQALWNRVAVRFALFAASTLAPVVVAIDATRAVL